MAEDYDEDSEEQSKSESFKEREMVAPHSSILDQPGVADRGSVLEKRVSFTFDSLKQVWAYEFWINYGRAIRRLVLFGLIIAIAVTIAKVDDPRNIGNALLDLAKGLWGILVAIVMLIIIIILVNPWTFAVIWGYIPARIVGTIIFSRVHDVFVILWMDGYDHLRIVLYPRYFDSATRWYIGGIASFWYKLIHGIPRIRFHQSMMEGGIDFLQVSIEEISDGLGATTVYEGHGVVLQTDPSDDIPDNQEAAEIIRYIDIPAEEEGFVYRQCYIDRTKVLPLDVWQSILAGRDLKYWSKYAEAMRYISLLEREIEYLKVDGSLKFAQEFVVSHEHLGMEARGEDLDVLAKYRDFDDIGKQLSNWRDE